MDFEIKLRIAYQYANPAVGGRHVACVMPLALGAGQTVQSATLTIEPAPQERVDRLDFFGNRVTEFSFRGPHDSVTLTMRARVTRDAVPRLWSGRCDWPICQTRWRSAVTLAQRRRCIFCPHRCGCHVIAQ